MSESTWEKLAQEAYEVGRAAWPGVALPREPFTRHLARLPRVGEGGQTPEAVEQALEKLKVADLYLACACALRVPGAVETFEKHHLSRLPEQLKRLRHPQTLVEEVCQQVRIHLLVGTEGREPRIAEYAGRGTLKSWVWAIALRMIKDQGRAGREELMDDEMVDEFAALAAPGRDAEMELIRRHHEREFREALREAFRTLPEDQRYLLRLRHLDRLTQAAIARLFAVTQPTIQRRLELAHEALFAETKRRLKAKLALTSEEFESLVKELRSRMELSLSQVLKEDNSQEEDEGEED